MGLKIFDFKENDLFEKRIKDRLLTFLSQKLNDLINTFANRAQRNLQEYLTI